MIVPSIDLMNGRAVQLIGGREKAIDAGDPRPIAERFALAGEIAVIDLDAALGSGSNAELIRELIRITPCRVGGGIRDLKTAVEWLDAGASKVILGTAATPELLRELPPERTIAALDADHGTVVVEGWRRSTGESIASRMERLRGLVGGFLVTFVEREGRMAGTNLDSVSDLVAAAGGARITIAGGITSASDIARIDALGAESQVGMAIYTGRLDLADAIAAPLPRRRRQKTIWPTVVVDELGQALGLAWSSPESLREAVRTRRGIYQSRKRGLWFKGATSGNTQTLLRIDLDCDRDALRFTVCQEGAGFCHTGSATCWGALHGLSALEDRLAARAQDASDHSYTARLLADTALLRDKLIEEAAELADAHSPDEAIHEAADLLYFASVAMRARGISLHEVATELDRRALCITRRPGNAKPPAGVTP